MMEYINGFTHVNISGMPRPASRVDVRRYDSDANDRSIVKLDGHE